jgi:DNA-binding NarL/FixJ family response regulator
MDLRMPNLDGVDATQQIRAAHPDVKVLILSTYDSDNYVIQALRSGANGYVLKDSEVGAIISSVVAVSEGESVLSGSIAGGLIDMARGAAPAEQLDGLTPRELQILKMVAAGLANKQIAYRLKLSQKTVRNHISNIYAKLHIADRSQAVLYAVRKGLVDI